MHSSLVLQYFQQQIGNKVELNNDTVALKKANSMANLQTSTSKKVANVSTESSKQNKAMSRLPSKVSSDHLIYIFNR